MTKILSEKVKIKLPNDSDNPDGSWIEKSYYEQDENDSNKYDWIFKGKLNHPITKEEIATDIIKDGILKEEILPIIPNDKIPSLSSDKIPSLSSANLDQDIQDKLEQIFKNTNNEWFLRGKLWNKNSVGPNNLQDGAVTEDKILKDAVTTDKIQDGAITVNKLSKTPSGDNITSLWDAFQAALDFSEIQTDIYGDTSNDSIKNPKENSVKKRVLNNESAIETLKESATKIDITPIEGDAGHSGTDYYYTINITSSTSEQNGGTS